MAKRSVSEFFDSYSHDFDSIYGKRSALSHRMIDEVFRKSMRLRFVKSMQGCDPIEQKTVLDVGCGPGHFGVALARRGAGAVLGVDFADSMIAIAIQNAARANVADRCEFIVSDFMAHPIRQKFDYSIVMGFMDYVAEPRKLIEKVLGVTGTRAFFSFPVDGTFLAWQRKLRYRSRCDLFMYREPQIEELFRPMACKKVQIEKISRDYFVTAHVS